MTDPTEDLIRTLTDQAREGDEAVSRLARLEALVRCAERRGDAEVPTRLLRLVLEGDK